MKPKIKLCGLTRLADARYAAGAGVDYLGFIQYKGSPRYITPKEAKTIIDWLYGPETVGVFVNEDADVINEIADEAGFSMVQLHGTEHPAVVEAVDRPTIKTIPVVSDASHEQLRILMEPYLGVADYFLLDTHKTGLWGGTGESFNWRLARELSSEVPLFLAGGIDADNVEEAILTMRPYAVDLSSSVESAPGIKDIDKMADFFDAFEAATATLES
ncbi:MAG: phosphoribosylanthranilate isomerase [Bacteroidota bacterium]